MLESGNSNVIHQCRPAFLFLLLRRLSQDAVSENHDIKSISSIKIKTLVFTDWFFNNLAEI